MKKQILLIGIMMLSLTVVSAYDFDYTKPEYHSHEAFTFARLFGTNNPMVQLIYTLITDNSFLRNQLAKAEKEIKVLSRRRSSGHSVSVQYVQAPEIIPEVLITPVLGDANGDGILNNNDITPLREGLVLCLTTDTECDKDIYDLDGDGSINNNDLGHITKVIMA